MDMKVEKSTAPAVGSSDSSCRGGGEQNKTSPKSEGETVNMDGVCFDCSDGNHTNTYYQGMRKVADYFGMTDAYGTDIQSTSMKEATKIITRPVKVNTGNAEIDKMLLGKELSEWVQRTSKL